MKESNGKKITAMQVYKVIMIIYSIAMLALSGLTIYGWATNTTIIEYPVLAGLCAAYCASAAAYESNKKKQEKKKEENS